MGSLRWRDQWMWVAWRDRFLGCKPKFLGSVGLFWIWRWMLFHWSIQIWIPSLKRTAYSTHFFQGALFHLNLVRGRVAAYFDPKIFGWLGPKRMPDLLSTDLEPRHFPGCFSFLLLKTFSYSYSIFIDIWWIHHGGNRKWGILYHISTYQHYVFVSSRIWWIDIGSIMAPFKKWEYPMNQRINISPDQIPATH